ncbi:ABC transporter permease subunit [Evansella tamaricis]|uniref:ABC transporter permease subunit n=1 Tax=Evansella tamaricis TaxID=2069301 RepID=A0ABS6JDF9_9BACI|nr:ABC transporter permease subunit [Evansella tamaricis]MBU9711513.1 ABC transporter permease subunit [Evansella tamaricis]
MKKLANQSIIIFIYLLLLLTIIFLVFLPRGLEFTAYDYHVERNYIYDWSLHKERMQQFFQNLLNGSMGTNIYNNPVKDDVILYFFSRSFPVIIGSFFFSLLFAVMLGTLQFKYHHKVSGKLLKGFTWIIQAIPDFFLYIIVQITLFQLFRIGFPTFAVYGYDEWYSYLFAIGLISLLPSTYLAMIITPSLLDESSKRYVQTAESKGLPSSLILWKHQWSNIAQKVSSHLHTLMLMIIGNLLILEYLFFLRGAAMRAYQALGFHGATIMGSYRSMVSDQVFEPEVIVWMFSCFLLVIYITHVIQAYLTNYFRRKVG